MFQFIKERKAAAALDRVVEKLPETFKSCSGTERCAALAVTNAWLLAGASDYGRNFSHRPMALAPVSVYEAIGHLADSHRQKTAAADKLSGRPALDPIFSAYKWEMLALEVVMVTVGCSIHEEARNAAREIWNRMKLVKVHSEEAVKALQIYARVYSIDPIPKVKNRNPDRSFLTALATHLPPMFEPRAASGKPAR